jgi:hypothetical protein
VTGRLPNVVTRLNEGPGRSKSAWPFVVKLKAGESGVGLV